jgi:uncharacterized sporulation protein YeaH/YhbH (DUF444 family)
MMHGLMRCLELQGRRSACDSLDAKMTEAEKKVRAYLAEIGRRGGITSRRDLTKSHARQMVAIREAKRAALKAGKAWPPRNRKLIKLS